MEKRISPEEAVKDFLKNVLPTLFEGESRYKNKNYNRIKQLEYAVEGRGKKKFTATWAEIILNEFAPGRYVFEHQVTVIVKAGVIPEAK